MALRSLFALLALIVPAGTCERDGDGWYTEPEGRQEYVAVRAGHYVRLICPHGQVDRAVAPPRVEPGRLSREVVAFGEAGRRPGGCGQPAGQFQRPFVGLDISAKEAAGGSSTSDGGRCETARRDGVNIHLLGV